MGREMGVLSLITYAARPVAEPSVKTRRASRKGEGEVTLGKTREKLVC